jgi:dTDP-4-amino-4,6-dideoxygalactose transaminase
VGSFGHAAAFSFFSNKNLSIGEGGMVATDDERLARDVRLLRSHGLTALSWERHHGHSGDTEVRILGFNYRFDDPRAALGLSRLRRLDDDNARRAELDARYRESLSGIVGCAMPPAAGVSSAHYIFTIVLPEGVDRTAFRERLGADGIQTSVHYPAAHRLSAPDDGVPELPVTDDYADRTVTLPLFPHMTPAQQDTVVDAVSRTLER